jgi:hypothetical protein
MKMMLEGAPGGSIGAKHASPFVRVASAVCRRWQALTEDISNEHLYFYKATLTPHWKGD